MKEDKELTVKFVSYLLLDAVHDLAREYSLPVDFIINVAVKRLVEDVEALRKLRSNTYTL